MTADLRRFVKKMWRCSKYSSVYARQRNHKQVRGSQCHFLGILNPEKYRGTFFNPQKVHPSLELRVFRHL